MHTYHTTTELETIALGKQFASFLTPGNIVTLSGDLGAGKTTFMKGVAEGFAIQESITSPTFTIMNVYPISDQKNNLKQIVHVDTYRLETAQNLLEI